MFVSSKQGVFLVTHPTSEINMASAQPLIQEIFEEKPLGILEVPPQMTRPVVNRRILPRVKAPFTVYMQETGSEVRGIDLSFGGLMCMANEPIWPGNVTSLELRLSGMDKPMTFNARVVEIVTVKGQLSMRLRFEGASDTVRKNIAKWMSRNA